MVKLKVMLKYANGFIMSKCQMKTVDGGIGWQFAKSPGKPGGVLPSAEIFVDHGYDLVEWDDDQDASDGTMTIERG